MPETTEVSPHAQADLPPATSCPRADSVPLPQVPPEPPDDLEVLENGVRNPNVRARATFASQVVTIEQMTEEIDARESILQRLFRTITVRSYFDY